MLQVRPTVMHLHRCHHLPLHHLSLLPPPTYQIYLALPYLAPIQDTTLAALTSITLKIYSMLRAVGCPGPGSRSPPSYSAGPGPVSTREEVRPVGPVS
jgi:hypothetical protein